MSTHQLALERDETLRHSSSSSAAMPHDSLERRNRLAEMIAATAEVMGTEISPAALNLFVNDLIPFPDGVVELALVRCRREIRGRNGFPPNLTIADVLERTGVPNEADIEAGEERAAWDELQRYIQRHVVRNPEGVYEEVDFIGNRATVPRPALPQRIRNSVRRVGGWAAVVNPALEDYPHVQRRFFEAYRTWVTTEIALERVSALEFLDFEKLSRAKSMDQAALAKAGCSKKVIR